jgi:hypothetical protein
VEIGPQFTTGGLRLCPRVLKRHIVAWIPLLCPDAVFRKVDTASFCVIITEKKPEAMCK